MQCVTAVDGQWLAELGPMFYSVKDSTQSRGVSNHLCIAWLRPQIMLRPIFFLLWSLSKSSSG
jgi:hypothetical protein